MENWVMQDSGGGGGQKTGKRKRFSSKPKANSMVVPRGITKTQKRRLQKMRRRELAEKKEEEERDYSFNCFWPMTKPQQMWQGKWLAKEEGGSSGDNSGEEVSKVALAKGKDILGSGDGNPESGNCNPKMECLSGKELMGYSYISIGKDGFVSISVKPMIGVTRLAHDL
jgi:hypothetical protein